MRSLASAIALIAAFALAASGCSKNSSSQTSSNATGPVTDAASSGLKSAAGTHAALARDAVRGKQLFSQNCASCHGADGTQGGVGPSLRNEKSRKNTVAAIAWIKNPQPPMPKLYPSPLSERDVSDLAAYVETL